MEIMCRWEGRGREGEEVQKNARERVQAEGRSNIWCVSIFSRTAALCWTWAKADLVYV